MTGWDTKFGLLLLSQSGSTYKCLSRFFPEIQQHASGIRKTNQPSVGEIFVVWSVGAVDCRTHGLGFKSRFSCMNAITVLISHLRSMWILVCLFVVVFYLINWHAVSQMLYMCVSFRWRSVSALPAAYVGTVPEGDQPGAGTGGEVCQAVDPVPAMPGILARRCALHKVRPLWWPCG